MRRSNKIERKKRKKKKIEERKKRKRKEGVREEIREDFWGKEMLISHGLIEFQEGFNIHESTNL